MNEQLKEYIAKKNELKSLRNKLTTWTTYGEFDENYKQCEEEIVEYLKSLGFVHDKTETDSYTGNWKMTYIGQVDNETSFFNNIIDIEANYDIEDTLDRMEREERGIKY